MIRQYLPDLCKYTFFGVTRLKTATHASSKATYSSNAIWGYTIGGCTTMELKEREVIIASSIIASGAARQARSHCKAALQLGNPPKLLQVLDDVAQELAHWNGTRLPEKLNVPQLAAELRAELEKLK